MSAVAGTIDRPSTFSFTDFFCGAGGSITGLVESGAVLDTGANHDPRSIETVSSNHDAEFLCADINHLDMRRIKRSQVLWASVLCTEASPAGGKARRRTAQLELIEEDGPVRAATFERTRACALDVVRATEIHRYDAIVVENVVEFARDWELYDWWVEGVCKIRPGYQVQVINVSAAHVGDDDNPHAPQWRDRIFILFVKNGIRMPDLQPRPLAWCPRCDVVGETHQSRKRPDRRRVGTYGQQYVYKHSCGVIVEPFVLPAAAAIDWSNLGQRIGDRKKPLAAATMRRIRAGLAMFAQPTVVTAAGNTYEAPTGNYRRAWPAFGSPLMARTGTAGDGIATPADTYCAECATYDHRGESAGPWHSRHCSMHDGTDAVVLNVNHHGDDGRPYPSGSRPMAPRTTKVGDGVALPAPFVTMLRAHNQARGVDVPLDTLTTGRNHALTIPPGAFVSKHHGGLDYERIEHMNKSVDEPLPTIVTKPNASLVIPYRKGSLPYGADAAPMHTITTKESHALLTITDDDVLNSWFRMFGPLEHAAGQRFPFDYVWTGNQGEITMQAGNAVPCNVAHWIGRGLAEVLGG